MPIKTNNNLSVLIDNESAGYVPLNLIKGWNLISYPSLEEKNVNELFEDVITRINKYLIEIENGTLNESHEKGNRRAKRIEVLLEMLEHSIQHRGQILVYYRLLGIEPVKIPYII